MKSKTIAALMLCAAWMLCLWGCESAEPTQTTQADAPQVGMCFRKQADSEIPQYPQLLTQALTDAGYTVRTAAAGNDQSKQNTQFKKFLDEKVDLLVVEPVMVGTAGDLIRQAQAADIPLVFVNREPEDQDLKLWEKTCYVGCNRELASLLQGSIVLNTPDQGDINGDGTVCYGVIGGPIYDLDAQARTARCTELLTEAGVQVELLACQNGDWSDENGRQSCASLLSTYGKDLEVLFCNSDEIAAGAMEAIRDGGRQVGKDIYLVGCEARTSSVELVRSGELTGSITSDPARHVEQTVQAVKRLLSGEPVEKQYYVDYQEVQ